MIGILQHPDREPDDFTLLGAVLCGVADDAVRVGRRIKETNGGVDMIEITDDLLLFGTDEFQKRSEFTTLFDKPCDGVGRW